LHGKSKGEDGELEFINSFQTVFTLAEGLHLTGDYTYTHNPLRLFTRRTQAPWSIYPGVISYLGSDRLTEVETTYNEHVVNIFGDYSRTFGEHNLKVTAGFNREHVSYKRITGIRNDLLSEDLNDFNLGSGDMEVSGGANTWALMGFFGRVNYDYKSKYLVEINGRYDGTSKFPEDQRFGTFPSISAGWRISEEAFFSPLKAVVNELKVRGSYGSLGNAQEASVYGYIPLLNRGNTPYIMDGRRTEFLSVPTPISPQLTWERATTANFGVDIGLFDNRLSTSFDYYVRETLDMLVPGRTLPAVFGAASPRQNAGDLRNVGWELAVSWNDQKNVGGKPFGYNFSVGLSDSKAEITRFDNPSKQLNNFYVGQQLGEIWGYRIDGLFQSDEEAANWAINQDYVDQQRLRSPGNWSNLQAGDVKFVDVNGDGKVDPGLNTLDDPGDQVVIGNSLPRYTFGINLGANWNGFDLAAFFQGIGQQHWYPGNNADKFWGPYSRPYFSFVPRDFTDDVWTPENPDAYFPLLRGYIALNDRGSLNVRNDRYLQDLAYVRLKNLTVGYSLPLALLEKASVSRARIFVSGENLFTLTKLRSDYIDPEQAAGETNGRAYPFSKTFSLGIDITF
jgi:TonB-linked SusC/RagA family outer membrane protein